MWKCDHSSLTFKKLFNSGIISKILYNEKWRNQLFQRRFRLNIRRKVSNAVSRQVRSKPCSIFLGAWNFF